MSKKMVILLNCAKNDAERATVALSYSCAAASAGHEVLLAANGEGAMIAIRDGVADEIWVEGMRKFSVLLETFINAGGRAVACTPCFVKRGYTEDQLRPGFSLAMADDVIAIVAESDHTLSF